MDRLLWVLAALVGLDTLMNIAVYRRLAAKEPASRTEERVQEAMDTEAERRAQEMDEGFDNLMSFSVPLGRGRNTGGEP